MEYRQLGGLGLKVSALALGTLSDLARSAKSVILLIEFRRLASHEIIRRKSFPMNKIRVIARAVARHSKETEVRDLLRGMLAPTRNEVGCEVYELFESHTPGTFYFYELWESKAALDRHAATPHYLDLQEQLTGLLAGPFEVSLVHNLGEET